MVTALDSTELKTKALVWRLGMTLFITHGNTYWYMITGKNSAALDQGAC